MWTLLLPAAIAAPDIADPLRLRLQDLPELAPDAVRVGVLPSGMRLVVEERHDQARVGVSTVFPGGSGADPSGREGAAHLAEHVWFRSPSDVEGASVDERLQALTAEYQGLTGPEDTLFSTVAPASALPVLLALEERRVRGFSVENGAVEAERRIVSRELTLRGTENLGTLFDWTCAALFPGSHPYHRWAAQSQQGLSAVTADDVRAAASRWRPSGATLVLTGDLPAGDALDALLAEVAPSLTGGPAPLTLGTWPAAPPREPVPHPASLDLGIRRMAVDEPTLAFAWALPGSDGADLVQLDAAAGVAEALLTWVLDDASPEGEARGTSCSLDVRPLASTLICTFPVGRGTFPDTLAVETAREFDRRLFAGINEGVDAQRKYAVAFGQVRARARAEALAAGELGATLAAARDYHRFGIGASFAVYSRRLGQVGALEMLDVARRWLTRDHLATLLALPDAERPELEAPDLHGASVDAGASLPIAEVPAFQLQGLEERRLANGLTVVAVPVPGSAVTRAQLVVRAGPTRQAAALIDTLLFESLGVRDRESAETVLRLVANWDDDRSGNGHRMGVEGPSRKLGSLLAVLGERVSLLRPDVVAAAPIYRAHRARARARFPWLVAADEADELLFGAHPLGRRPVVAGLPLFAPQSPSAVHRAFARLYRPENSALIVVGAFDVAEVFRSAEEAFGRWRGKRRATAAPETRPLPAPPVPTVRTYVAPVPVTLVRGVCRVEDGSAGAHAVIEQLAYAAAWRTLREELGATYAPSASIWASAGHVAELEVTAPVAIGTASAAVEAIRGVFASLAKVDDAVLQRARLRVAARRATMLRTGAGLLGALADAWERELPWTAAAAGESLDPAAVARMVRPCAGHEVIAVVGPASDVTQVRSWQDGGLQ